MISFKRIILASLLIACATSTQEVNAMRQAFACTAIGVATLTAMGIIDYCKTPGHRVKVIATTLNKTESDPLIKFFAQAHDADAANMVCGQIFKSKWALIDAKNRGLGLIKKVEKAMQHVSLLGQDDRYANDDEIEECLKPTQQDELIVLREKLIRIVEKITLDPQYASQYTAYEAHQKAVQEAGIFMAYGAYQEAMRPGTQRCDCTNNASCDQDNCCAK